MKRWLALLLATVSLLGAGQDLMALPRPDHVGEMVETPGAVAEGLDRHAEHGHDRFRCAA